MEWLRDTSIFHPGDFPGWMGYIIGPSSSPKWPIWELEGFPPKCQTLRFFFCFFSWHLGAQRMVFVVGLGFGGLDFLGSMDKQNRWLIVDSWQKKTPSLNIFGMVQLPTKYFNIQLWRGEGFKSATCWRKKSTQETDRKTHWDQPSTKRNLDFSLTKWRFPCS